MEGGVSAQTTATEIHSAKAVHNLKLALVKSSLGLEATDGSSLTVRTDSFISYPAKGRDFWLMQYNFFSP